MNNACYAVMKKSQTASADYNPEVDVSVSTSEGRVMIAIRDNGIGMSDEVKQRLYENFFTTKPVGEGTGLGMGIIRDIVVNKHDGEILLDTQEGEYTSFTINIPLKLK
jgi:signal transduction histidine kinase